MRCAPPPCRTHVILTKPAARAPIQPNRTPRQAREGSPMNGAWRLHRRSFPTCAEGCGNALIRLRAAHAGQDDRVVRWAGHVEKVKNLNLHGTYCSVNEVPCGFIALRTAAMPTPCHPDQACRPCAYPTETSAPAGAGRISAADLMAAPAEILPVVRQGRRECFAAFPGGARRSG